MRLTFQYAIAFVLLALGLLLGLAIWIWMRHAMLDYGGEIVGEGGRPWPGWWKCFWGAGGLAWIFWFSIPLAFMGAAAAIIRSANIRLDRIIERRSKLSP
jgi:hypothetical protein